MICELYLSENFGKKKRVPVGRTVPFIPVGFSLMKVTV
jgi:hypothetical protein